MSSYNIFIFIFVLVRTAFLSLYKIFKGENSPDNYKTSEISTEEITKNPEMLKMCKNAVNKLPFAIMYVLDRYENQELCEKIILKNGGELRFIPDCCKNQKTCDKSFDTYPSPIQFVPECECYTTQKMSDKAVDTCHFVFDPVPGWCSAHEMCDKLVSEEPFMLKYCLDGYKTQEMCDKAVDAFLSTLKFVPDWFVENEMLGKLENVLFSNDDTDLDVIDSDIVTFFSHVIGLNNIDLNNINLDDDDFE